MLLRHKGRTLAPYRPVGQLTEIILDTPMGVKTVGRGDEDGDCWMIEEAEGQFGATVVPGEGAEPGRDLEGLQHAIAGLAGGESAVEIGLGRELRGRGREAFGPTTAHDDIIGGQQIL